MASPTRGQAPRWSDNRPLSVFSVAPLSPISPLSISAFERPRSRMSAIGDEAQVGRRETGEMVEVGRVVMASGSGLGRQEEERERVGGEVLPSKLGEIGYRASLQPGAASVTAAGEHPLPPTSSTPPHWLGTLDFKVSAKLPAGFGRLLALFFAFALFIGTLTAFLLIVTKKSNKTSTTIVAPIDPTTMQPTGNSTTPVSQDEQLMLGLNSSSFIYMVFIIFLILELSLLLYQIRQTYTFHRRRYLHRTLAIPPDLESSSPSHSPTLFPYTPSGPLRIIENLLLLRPTTLIPPSAPSLTPHEPTLELSPEEEAIQRAQQTGAAPRYGSEEMQGSTTLLTGPKMRGRTAERFSWRSVRVPSYRSVLRPLALSRSASIVTPSSTPRQSSFAQLSPTPRENPRRASLPSPIPSPRSPVVPSRSSSYRPSLPTIVGASETGGGEQERAGRRISWGSRRE